MMSTVQEMRPDWLTAVTEALAHTTVGTVKMLELGAPVQTAPKEPSDCKEAHALPAVWRFVTTTSGAQCVTTCGTLWMQE